MKFAIYQRERVWAREMGDPKLTEVEATSKEEAEWLTPRSIFAASNRRWHHNA
jgi:hypothetical protein